MMRILQSIEELWRWLFLGVLVRLFGGRRPAGLPDWSTRPHRVLFIRNDGIGDLLISMEVMRAIAESAPGITLDVLASPQNAALARTLPFVRDVIVHRRRFLLRAWPTWKLLRSRRYDAVVDGRVVLRGLSTQTAALLLSTGAPWRIGVGGRRNDSVYSVKVTPASTGHWTDYVVALAGPFGVRPDSRRWSPQLSIAPPDRERAEQMWRAVGSGRPRVLVNVSVGHPERSWPPEKFARVLARVRDRLPGATLVLSAMPAEQAMADDLARPVAGRAVPLSLQEVFAALATADLLISPETAITHAAAAFQTPTLALQRKGNSRWSPYLTPGRNVFADDERRLVDLPVDRVLAALDELIDELGPTRGWLA
jgi:heptosyltransferase-3